MIEARDFYTSFISKFGSIVLGKTEEYGQMRALTFLLISVIALTTFVAAGANMSENETGMLIAEEDLSENISIEENETEEDANDTKTNDTTRDEDHTGEYEKKITAELSIPDKITRGSVENGSIEVENTGDVKVEILGLESEDFQISSKNGCGEIEPGSSCDKELVIESSSEKARGETDVEVVIIYD